MFHGANSVSNSATHIGRTYPIAWASNVFIGGGDFFKTINRLNINLFRRNTYGCSVSYDSSFNDDAGDDRVSGLEHEVGHDPQLAGEDDNMLELLLLLPPQVLLVGREPIEQMINDVSLKGINQDDDGGPSQRAFG